MTETEDKMFNEAEEVVAGYLLGDRTFVVARQQLGELLGFNQRIAELNAAMVKLSNELPYPDEVRDWTEQRGKLMAEIGTLRAAIASQAEALDRERRLGKTVITSAKITNYGVIGNEVGAIPMLLYCPICGHRHIDEGEFATKPHHTHACQNAHCGHVWRPAIVPTCGVAWLPGFRNSDIAVLEKGGSTMGPLNAIAHEAMPRHAQQTMELQRKMIGDLIDRIPIATRLPKEFLVEAIESAIRRSMESFSFGTNASTPSSEFIHHATSNAVQTILLHLATSGERDERQKQELAERKQTSHLDKCSQCGEVVTECHTCEPRHPAYQRWREENACKVCENKPDEEGTIEHGRGCYVADEDGGGTTSVEPFTVSCDHPLHRRGTSGGLRRNQEVCMQCGSIVEKSR